MASCCTSGSCTCKIESGDANITVTGLGSTGSPFIIGLNSDVPIPENLDEAVALLIGADSDTREALAVRGPFYLPEDYGAVGDGVTDDTVALQACFDAAFNAGGGTVFLKNRYGWTGDLFHRGAITVMGPSRRKVLVVDDEMDRGLVALSSTSRYRYGNWSSPASIDDNPGPLLNLVIDGNNTSASAELVLMQCVDGLIDGCNIVRPGSGHALQVAGAQNSTVSNSLIGYAPNGSAIDFYHSVGQGAGSVKIDNCYLGDSLHLMTSDAAVGQYWPHDIFLTQCLFENYTEGNDLLHLKAGDFIFSRCVITNSNDGVPAPSNNCLVLVEQTAWPTIPTQVTFDSCYFNGSIGLDHHIRTVTPVGGVGNYVRFYGKSYAIGADYLVCLDAGGAFSSAVTVDGDVFRVGGGGLTSPAWYVAINGAWMSNVQRRTAMPVRWEMPTDSGGFLPDPVVTKREGDAQDRFRISRDGTLRWGSGTDATIGGGLVQYDTANDRMQLGGSIQITNALELRGLISATVSAPATAVALTGAKTAAPYQLIYFDTTAATANITISGGHVGSVMLVGLQGTGANLASWSADFHFNGTPPQPRNGTINYVWLKQELDGDWHEICRSMPPVNQVRENRVTTGQEVLPRETVDQNNVVTASGLLELTYFTAYKTEVITQIRSYTGNTAAGATPTLCRMGLYSVAANGDLTLIAAHASDTALWATTNTAYTKTLTAPVMVVEGNRYAFGRLIVTGAAAPAWPTQGISPALAGVAPRIQGQLTGQTDLPASITAGTVVSGSVRRYGEILP